MPTKLGQNFLTNQTIAEKIVASADLSPADTVLEIGPGRGFLTEKLLSFGGKIIAVEKDARLADFLKNKFSSAENLQIISDDILKINLPALLAENSRRYKVVANIPYYITAKILRLLLTTKIVPQEIILLIQKEVAERIVAPPGKMSKLSLLVQFYAESKILFPVGRENFRPAPKVDSAVIKLTPRRLTSAEKEKIERIMSLARAGFGARRKTLLNNLSAVYDREKIIVAWKNLNFNTKIRAQELSPADWVKLFEEIKIPNRFHRDN